MKVGERASSETFADYTLSRVPRVIRESLTDEQYQAIRTSLIARDTDSRHSIDIRLTIPLFFRSYYFIFLQDVIGGHQGIFWKTSAGHLYLRQ